MNKQNNKLSFAQNYVPKDFRVANIIFPTFRISPAMLPAPAFPLWLWAGDTRLRQHRRQN